MKMSSFRFTNIFIFNGLCFVRLRTVSGRPSRLNLVPLVQVGPSNCGNLAGLLDDVPSTFSSPNFAKDKTVIRIYVKMQGGNPDKSPNLLHKFP